MDVDVNTGTGRVAQRRRTRRAIVEATAALLSEGREPSIGEIAAAADVSRRTVYLHFPTLDQLLLDATVGRLSSDIDALVADDGEGDVRRRVERLVDALCDAIAESLPAGRRLIRLTVDQPSSADGPKRGYRRVGWVEQVLAPARDDLEPEAFERLVSSLCVVLGWEAFIVLQDVRGLDLEQCRAVLSSSALALLDAALS